MAAQLEEERKQYVEQLEIVATSLRDDPENGELQALKDELDQMIQMLDESLADLKPSHNAPKPPPPRKAATPPPPPAEEKWSRENHPAFKKPPPPVEEKEPDVQQAASYQVNDTVMAKWVSGDKAFYPARITAVTGSSTNPIYTVKFKSYDTVETLRTKDIRPVAQKRKADGAPVASSSGGSGSGSNSNAVGGLSAPSAGPQPPVSQGAGGLAHAAPSTAGSGVVLSAAASLYPPAQAKADGAEKDEEGKAKPKFKKIKANKELEKGKNKWQEFNTSGKFGKSGKKDSMFRTPEGVHGRVGFIGSGQTMRKDPTRSRHIYQTNEELD